MAVAWGWIAVGVAAGGFAAVPLLVVWGLRRLDAVRYAASWPLRGVAAGAGVVAGVVAVAAADRAGSLWWLPALACWSATLAAATVCDARTQRIPTPLVRTGMVTTGVLLVVAGIVTADWRAPVLSAAAAAGAGLVLLLCWRFAGVGFGDVRLAVLGGLGLGHTHYRAVILAVLVFAVLAAAMAAIAYARTRDRRAMIAYGPALAAGFLLAAVA
jgi:leader peptidase (prepilin peptidase)/N-methyltransferase